MSNISNNSEIKNQFNNNGYENDTDVNNINAPKKKRRRRPNPETEDLPNNVADISNETPKRRPRRKRRNDDTEQHAVYNNNIGVAAYLEDLQDDIEIEAANYYSPYDDQLGLSRGKAAASQGVGDTVYIEGTRKFRAENQEKYNDKLKESQKISERLNIDENRYDNDLMQCVITITERFRVLATFVHAIFAGLVLMYTVFSLIASKLIIDSASQKGILSIYALIQQPFSIFNYLMLIFIGVSIMDRCDMARPSSSCNQKQSGIIVALILIMVAFIINNSLYYYNPYFLRYATNNSYLSPLVTVFPNWSIVDAAKSVLVCIAWFVVALLPIYDRFVENLYIEIKQERNNDNVSDKR